ncbi:hypothetical protein MKZ38_006665 [Zalerion maritima]|uniref:NACHT domain-containing protein n=1 Tax=Zalerion maritima TaxID=339359 RepID=A0AAD5RWF3_9PEZI|nr:hypothetical protein MKZ38_006665 [Zalerion maritima]
MEVSAQCKARWMVVAEVLMIASTTTKHADMMSVVPVARNDGLDPHLRLAAAVSEFEADLSMEEKTALRRSTARAVSFQPKSSDVMALTAEIDRRAREEKRVRCFGPRFTNFLHGVQQFAALGDVLIGGSQNLIACGVWSIVRMTLLAAVNFSGYLDRLSSLFMAAGRAAPRYQAMATVYSDSQSLQGNLAEYFTVVVRLCHDILKFTKKSTLGQLVSSLSDSDIHSYQSELDVKANAIKEEVNLLVAKRLESEASKNSIFRANWTVSTTAEGYRKRQRDRFRILDACSRYDHESTWKQLRKIGQTHSFQKSKWYRMWKAGPGARVDTLVFTGELGSGKSVLAANIVDDLVLKQASIHKDLDEMQTDMMGNLETENTAPLPVCFFFCRYDNSDSLNARTILGSFLRQLLDTLPELWTLSDLLHLTKYGEFDWDDLRHIVYRVLPSPYPAFLILDGIDECQESEVRKVVHELGGFQDHLGLRICITMREEADNIQRMRLDDFSRPARALIPDNREDISRFILAELENRVESGQLELGDPALVLEIQQALSTKAEGMFLWVVLQIESLCGQKTDEDIRFALSNLPKNLGETFARILRRSTKSVSDASVQRRILELMVSARRPLTTEELREALAVIPGHSEWRPERLINNIYSTLACCGCLILEDEEDQTVRFVHHSVRQFLSSPEFCAESLGYTMLDSESQMAAIVVTYLNLSLFDKSVSRTVVPSVRSGPVLTGVVQSTLKSKATQGMALKLLQSFKGGTRSHDEPQVYLSRVTGRKSTAPMEFRFFSYAKSYWLHHSWIYPDTLRQLPRMLSKGTIDLRATDEQGRTALFLAAKWKNLALARTLVEAGVDVNAIDSWGDTAITYSARADDALILDFLARQGARVFNDKFKGYSVARFLRHQGITDRHYFSMLYPGIAHLLDIMENSSSSTISPSFLFELEDTVMNLDDIVSHGGIHRTQELMPKDSPLDWQRIENEIYWGKLVEGIERVLIDRDWRLEIRKMSEEQWVRDKDAWKADEYIWDADGRFWKTDIGWETDEREWKWDFDKNRWKMVEFKNAEKRQDIIEAHDYIWIWDSLGRRWDYHRKTENCVWSLGADIWERVQHPPTINGGWDEFIKRNYWDYDSVTGLGDAAVNDQRSVEDGTMVKPKHSEQTVEAFELPG